MPKKSDREIEFKSNLQQIPIAVIGMACIFPQAKNLREYWDNIIRGVDSITDVPADRWGINDYYDSDSKVPDKTYCKRGGFLPDIDFDPMEFGMPPNILEVTDVSQLLSLIVAREVLEDAGYGESSDYNRDKVGIVLGVGGGQKLISPLNARLQYPVWKKVLKKEGISDQDADRICETIRKAYIPWEENSFPGMLGNVISGRVTNRLDLGGISCVLDAACASSMAALKMAISDLMEYRSDMIITGGVDTDNSIHMYMCFSKTPAFTADEKCRPFDADSSGMLIGEGIGMVALKRLKDAERDKDRIYAVIRGIGASSDGRFKSIYNPRPEGQARAIRRCYEDAGFHPSTVGLIEAHGTGTMAGDPAEVSALNDVFSENNSRKQHIALGSVKSQIGHTKAAAGAASFIKAVLALHHKILPPTINVTMPNPKYNLENSPIYINSATQPWVSSENGNARRAAVSSFGFGGTNFHMVLEEYQQTHTSSYRLHTIAQSVILSASNPKELIVRCNDELQKLTSEAGEKQYKEFLETCKSPHIPLDDARVGFVTESLSETCELLKLSAETLQAKGDEEYWDLPRGIYFRRKGMDLDGKIVALFSGQGSQYLEMGKELVYNFPPIMETLREMDRLFVEDGCLPLSQKIFPKPAFTQDEKAKNKEQLQQTEHAQPAIGTFSAGIFRVLEKAGFQFSFAAGHSFGELTALWAAKAINDADFLALAKARGKAMAAPDEDGFDAGSMLAVIGNFQKIQADISGLPNITIANLNSKKEVVVAGPTDSINVLQKSLKEKGHRVVPLPVSAAFHTTLVGHAQKPFAKDIQATTFQKPQQPVYSNNTGKPYPSDPQAIQKILKQHILKSVLFKEEIENIYDDGGRLFVEFGPKGILAKLVGNILEDRPHVAVALNPSSSKGSDRQLRQAVVKLRVTGMSLGDIDSYYMRPLPLKDKKPSTATVKLNGANYVSEKTRQAFTDALNDGRQIKQATISEKHIKESLQDKGSPGVGQPHAIQKTSADGQQVLQGLENSLTLFYKHQGETLKVHEQYLNNNMEYSNTFYGLMRKQFELMGSGLPNVPDSVENSMVMFHNHQGETLRVHEHYLRNQAEISKSTLEVMKQQTPVFTTGTTGDSSCLAPAVIETKQKSIVKQSNTVSEPLVKESSAIPPAATGPTLEALTRSMLEVVSEKTGYPTEMLELDMEIEADLGIDSIKRVEILGAMMEIYPDIPELNPEELAELRTIRQIIEHMESYLSTGGAVTQPTQEDAPPKAMVDSSPKTAPTAGTSSITGPEIEDLKQKILEIVSEKTGYPIEMLETDMKMEAELGIDRVKLVEILGAIREQYPSMGETDHDDFVNLLIVEDLVQYAGRQILREESAVSEILTAKEEVPQGFARLKPLPIPDFLDFNLPDNKICLITDDGTPTSAGLAESLSKDGWKVIVLSFPTSTIPEGQTLSKNITRVTLENLSEAHLEKTLKNIARDFGEVGGFIHLSPPHNPGSQDGVLSAETGKDILKHVFLIAKNLKTSLTETDFTGRRFFMTIARLNGSLGIGEGDFAIVDSGLFGLTKTLNLEWESVFCRAVDISPDFDADQSISMILGELHDPDGRIAETGWGLQGRVTLAAEDLELTSLDVNNSQIDSSSVFLVSGGAKGITAKCVIRLASVCKSKFILLGRSEFTGEEPAWARNCFNEVELKKLAMEELKARDEKPTPVKVEGLLKPVLADREISETLAAIQKAGGEAEYLSADITNKEALHKIHPVAERLGTITGVIHGAGVLADKMIEKKTSDDFEAVYSTKVGGLEALLSCLTPGKLKHLVLFSSAAAFFGNPGQSDYAVANEILNKTAYKFKHRYPDCHVTSFNWGPWDGGMVTDSLKKMFAERNVQVISIDGGTKVFVERLTANRNDLTQILVGSSMLAEGRQIDSGLRTYRVVRKLTLEENPFLQDHVIGGQAVLPTVCVTAWMADACEKFYPEHKAFSCKDFKTLKGIVFDESLAGEYVMDITEIRKSDSGEIEFEIKVSSNQNDVKTTHHYSARILLLPRIPECPSYQNFDRTENDAIDGRSLYEDGTLFHGPRFQAIERVINISREKITMECRVPKISEKDQGQFPVRTFNPFAADTQFQSMLIWVRKYYDAGSLPSRAGTGEQYQPVPADQTFYVSLDVKKSTKTRMTADITIHDDNSRVYSRVTGAEVTISKSLNHLFPKAK